VRGCRADEPKAQSAGTQPLTFARKVELIEREPDDHKASNRVVAALKQAGTLADPLGALIRAAGLRTVAPPGQKDCRATTRCWAIAAL
jgi:hypothetical protein